MAGKLGEEEGPAIDTAAHANGLLMPLTPRIALAIMPGAKALSAARISNEYLAMMNSFTLHHAHKVVVSKVEQPPLEWFSRPPTRFLDLRLPDGSMVLRR